MLRRANIGAGDVARGADCLGADWLGVERSVLDSWTARVLAAVVAHDGRALVVAVEAWLLAAGARGVGVVRTEE